MVAQKITDQMRRKWDKRIAFCIEHPKPLNDWETFFVDSLEHRRSDGKDLSFRQVQKLYQIFKKVEDAVG